MNVILHTTNCPRCKVLKSKLDQKNISYKMNTDVDLMIQKGFTTAPKLEIDGVVYDFKEAVEWIGEQ